MIQPGPDLVLVKKAEDGKRTAGGLHLPDVHKRKYFRGEVLAVGPGPITISGEWGAMFYKPGQSILYMAGHGTEIDDGVFLLRQGELLGVES